MLPYSSALTTSTDKEVGLWPELYRESIDARIKNRWVDLDSGWVVLVVAKRMHYLLDTSIFVLDNAPPRSARGGRGLKKATTTTLDFCNDLPRDLTPFRCRACRCILGSELLYHAAILLVSFVVVRAPWAIRKTMGQWSFQSRGTTMSE
jgi:hypothetical protein